MKNKKGIIIAAGVIALLLIGIIAVSNIGTEKEEPVSDGVKTNTVYKEDASNLSEILVKTENSSLKAVNTGKNGWKIDGFEEDEIDVSKASALAGTVASIISKNKFNSNGDFSQYGLENPQVTVTITKKNGEQNILSVGDMSPALGEYFIRMDDDESVYTLYAYKVDTLLKPREYYTEFDRFKVNVDDITDIKIERSGEPIEIKIIDEIDEDTNNVWEMVSPYVSGANDDYIDNKILAQIENISLSESVDEDGGFDGDKAVVTLTIKPYDNATGRYGEEYTETLVVGKTEGSVTYVEYKGDTYTTDAQSVAFVKDSAFNIVSKLRALVDISKVASVTVEYGGESHVIEIKKGNNKKYTFKLDGKETEADAAQEIYRNIIGLAVDGVYDGAPMGETIMKITFEGVKRDDDTVVEIKGLDNMNCVMVRNGAAEFTIRRNKIDEFTELFDVFVKAAREGAE